MPRFKHLRLHLCLLPLLAPALAGAQALVQDADPNAPISNEVHKCVRAGEIFYTNGACPSGTTEAQLKKGGTARSPARMAEPAAAAPRAEPLRTAPARAEPARAEPARADRNNLPVQRLSPRGDSVDPPSRGTFETPSSVQEQGLHTLKTVRASDLVPPRQEPQVESYGGSAGEGFRPLSSFPPLPESRGGRSGSRQDFPNGDDVPMSREMPVRAPAKYQEEAQPMADASADTDAMCGFVQAELERLETEAQTATADAKARIATHQKRLLARQSQLRC